MQVNADDMLIWNTGSGVVLTAYKDLVMEWGGERAFTAGLKYQVESMHPIVSPAYVVVKNDQGQLHRLEGSDVREYFRP